MKISNLNISCVACNGPHHTSSKLKMLMHAQTKLTYTITDHLVCYNFNSVILFLQIHKNKAAKT